LKEFQAIQKLKTQILKDDTFSINLDNSPIYTRFINNYSTGREEELYKHTNYKISETETKTIRWANSNDTNPWIAEGDRLLKLNEPFEIQNELTKLNGNKNGMDYWHRNNFVQIGQTHGDVVLLNRKIEESESIHLYGASTDIFENPIQKIANNIFHLFEQLVLVFDIELIAHYKLDPDKLFLDPKDETWKEE